MVLSGILSDQVFEIIMNSEYVCVKMFYVSSYFRKGVLLYKPEKLSESSLPLEVVGIKSTLGKSHTFSKGKFKILLSYSCIMMNYL